MTDKPIIFSAPMIRALLDGRKSMTRRIVKPQPVQNSAGLWVINYGKSGFSQIPADDVHEDFVLRREMPYTVGDRLYVREAHYLSDTGDYEIAVYAEDADAVREHFDLINSIAAKHKLPDAWKAPHLRLRPSIHMPRWASRLTLTVTDVSVERLQSISEADAQAEGCLMDPEPNEYGGRVPAEIPHERGGYVGWDCARDWLADLWDSIHGPDAWEANPWVCAISFTVQRGNIDQIGGTND